MPFEPESEAVRRIGFDPLRIPQEPFTATPDLLTETAPAAFRTENEIGSVLSDQMPERPARLDPAFDPFSDIQGYEGEASSFVHANTAEDVAAIKRQIDREREDRATMDAAGAGGLVAGFAAGVLSPINLIPVGGAAFRAGRIGASALRGAAVVGAAGAGSTALQEALLLGTQQVRTPTEAAINVAASTVLAGVLGGAVEALSASRRAALSDVIGRDLTPPRADEPDPMVGGGLRMDAGDMAAVEAAAARRIDEPTMEVPVAARAANDDAVPPPPRERGSAGAAATRADVADFEATETSFGADRLSLDPLGRTLRSPAVRTRQTAQELAESPVMFEKTRRGEVVPIAVETLIKAYDAGLFRGLKALDDAFVRYRLGRERRTGDVVATALADATGAARRAGKLDYKGFREEVGKAMRRNDEHPDPAIAAAAKEIRRQIFEPLKQRAIQVGLLPEDVDVSTADSYLNRLYDIPRIIAQRDRFTRIVGDWLEAEQSRKASIQADLADTMARYERVAPMQKKMARRMEVIDGRIKRIQAQAGERDRYGNLAERRVTTLRDRIGEVEQAQSELAEYIDAINAEIRGGNDDPGLRATLARMEKDLRALERKDRASLQKMMERADAEEARQAVAASGIEDAIKIVSGTRRPPKPPDLLDFLVQRGGLRDDPMGELRALGAKKSDKPGLFKAADGDGMTLDDALTAAHEAGFFMEFGDEPPTMGDFLVMIDDHLRGVGPKRYDPLYQDQVDLLDMVKALEDVVRRAGVDPRALKDNATAARFFDLLDTEDANDAGPRADSIHGEFLVFHGDNYGGPLNFVSADQKIDDYGSVFGNYSYFDHTGRWALNEQGMVFSYHHKVRVRINSAFVLTPDNAQDAARRFLGKDNWSNDTVRDDGPEFSAAVKRAGYDAIVVEGFDARTKPIMSQYGADGVSGPKESPDAAILRKTGLAADLAQDQVVLFYPDKQVLSSERIGDWYHKEHDALPRRENGDVDFDQKGVIEDNRRIRAWQSEQYENLLEEIRGQTEEVYGPWRDKIAGAAQLRRATQGGRSLDDLEAETADMIASGAAVPVGAEREAVGEAVGTTRAALTRAMNGLRKAKAAEKAAERKAVREGAREQEAAIFELDAERRREILAERLEKAQTTKAALADTARMFDEQVADLRARMEQAVLDWQGKSTRTAQGALERRSKAEVERAARAVAAGESPDALPRLRSADREVDRAVRRMLRAETRYERQELDDIADQITDRIISTPEGRLPYDRAEGGGQGYVPRDEHGEMRGPLKPRVFMIPDEQIEGFLVNDIEELARVYTRSMAPDVELVDRFGRVDMQSQIQDIAREYDQRIRRAETEKERKALEARKQADIRDIAAMRDRMRGTYGLPADPQGIATRASRAVMTLNLVRLLGGVTMASIPDVGRTVMVHGFGRSLRSALVPMVTNLRGVKLARKELQAAGTALDMVLQTRVMGLTDLMENYGRYSRFERGLQGTVPLFATLSSMNVWNVTMKQIAGMVTMSRTLEAADALRRGKISAKERRRLLEMGIPDHVAIRIAELAQEHGSREGGLWLPNTEAWTGPGAAEAVRAFRANLVKEVDRTIITPGQDKPLWLSTPLGRLLGQFKSFSMASQQRILVAGLQQRDMAALSGAILMVSLGMLSYHLRNQIAGRESSDDWRVWVSEGFDRSGLTGWLFEANNMAEKLTRGTVGVNALVGGPQMTRYASRGLWGAMLGPTAGLVEDVAQITGAAATGDWQESDTRAMRRLLPFQNVFYLAWLFSALESGVNETFGVPMRAG